MTTKNRDGSITTIKDLMIERGNEIRRRLIDKGIDKKRIKVKTGRLDKANVEFNFKN